MFVKMFTNNARQITMTLSLTFPNPAKILQLILVNTLKIKNGQISISNQPEYANLMPNNTEAILGPKAQNNHPILSANTEKYLYKIL